MTSSHEGIKGIPEGSTDAVRSPRSPQTSPESTRPRWTALVVPTDSSVQALVRLASAGNEQLLTIKVASQNRAANGCVGTPRKKASLLQRAVSVLMEKQLADVKKFRCYVCFDDVPVNGAVTLSSCGHRYCQACFASYLGVKINEGNIHPVCFHPIEAPAASTDVENPADASQTTCGVSVSEDQIKARVDADAWAKFERFRFNEEHAHARDCPYCALSQECEGPAQPSCICIGCEKLFCFFHGNAHENGTCADYELKNAEAESLSRAVINELAKPCPGCTRDIEKNGDCNHVKCVACATSFCWLCGEVVEDTPKPSHFDPTKASECSGKQFDGLQDTAATSTWLMVLLCLVAYPLMLPFALVATPFVWCCVGGSSISTAFELTYTTLLYWFGFTSSLLVKFAQLTLLSVFILVSTLVSLIFIPVVWLVEACCCSPRVEQTRP